MGKRKQKVRWCIVDGLAWNNGNEEEGGGEGDPEVGPARRSSGGREGWGQGASLAPRFERKAAAEQKHIYYEGEYCEAEELPNGFTKIRSKNLDILFKRDYYEQRLALQRLASEQEKEAAALEAEEEEGEEAEEAEGEMGSTVGLGPGDRAVLRSSRSFDQMDPSEIPEFKPTSGGGAKEAEGKSGNTSPFYGNNNYSPYPATYNQEYNYSQQQQAPPRPNLYLYSPSNNTLIPCEEIIIPNPVMSPEGPVYSGPTNIYLAYPVQGPDGRGYITQPFSGPSYSPGSVDSSNCYSSTPQTPNSGQDSGSSTQPASPPPLVNYHPANWVRPHGAREDPRPPARQETAGPRPAPGPPPAQEAGPAPAPAYIPGLPAEQLAATLQPKKAQKRRKKKKPGGEERRELLEHRGSTSSESEARPGQAEGAASPVESVQELQLTDDLADSLMNPPTEPEGSDSEPPALQRMEVEEELFLEDREVQHITESLQEAETVHAPSAVDVNENIPAVEEVVEVVEAVEVVESVEEAVVEEVVEEEVRPALPETTCHVSEECVLETAVEATKTPVIAVRAPAAAGAPGGEALVAQQGGARRPAATGRPRQRGKRAWGGKRDKKAAAGEEPVVSSTEQQQQAAGGEPARKSYSSAMKENLSAAENNIPAPVAAVRVPPATSREERQRHAAPRESRGQRELEDPWEAVPLSVSQPESWEKTPQSKKRKHKKSGVRFEESLLTEEAPVVMEPVVVEPVVVEPVVMPVVVAAEEPMAPAEEPEVAAEEEQEERRRGRRRRKKHASEDPEEAAAGRRVVICDDQVEIRFSRSVQRASEVLSLPQIDKVKTSGYCDFLIVSELGCGIQRGCMGLGRLYQGKYVPPERTDGLLPEEKRLQEELAAGEAEEAGVEAEEADAAVEEAEAADIDLD